MDFAPFMLDDWLDQHLFCQPPIEFDLASSTGPGWTFRQLLDLMDAEEQRRLFDLRLAYAPATGSDSLREAIAGMEGADPAHVQVVTGGAEALLLLSALAARPGANVVVPFPGFPSFSEIPRGFGLEVRYYQLRPEDEYRVDLDEIRKATDARTALLIVNTPHNPTGALLADEELTSLAEFAAERQVQFLVDQVYHPIYHGPETATAARLPQATVLGDFSKALCLPGLRIGWIVDCDARRLEWYRRARSYFTVSNTPVAEALAVAALRRRELIFGHARQVTAANLALCDKFFAEFPDVVAWVRPRGGMVAFPSLAVGGDTRPFCEAAAARGVLLAPGDCFGMPAHFRIGYGASGSRFAKGIERLAEFIRKDWRRAVALAKAGAGGQRRV
ncbi:MAG TPA: aminotransferase class I/II-fold pyridoxal phosphate-dependent enzyme [Candidatus Acidoferrales bacterium]|nr:aminotransferase class I/II-fold pyridoxal phosphate-dependent enzyme [Candidatus Acidoferrales bacterium]